MIRLPKNIRQIGTCKGTLKIYMEDYVETWTRQYAETALTECAAAVLIGACREQGEESAIFLYGAIKADCMEEGKIRFTERVWADIYEDIRKYFPDGEIMGWFLGGPSFLLETDAIQKVHADHFAGRDRVLLKYDALEQEEAFYVMRSGRLVRQDGYYIYYERNEGMQNYMVDHRLAAASSEESFRDDTTRKIRRTVEENRARAMKEEKNSGKPEVFPDSQAPAPEQESGSESRPVVRPMVRGMKGLVYTAGTLAAAVALIIGASALNRYEELQEEDALPVIAGNSGQVEAESLEESRETQEMPEHTEGSEAAGEENTEAAAGEDAGEESVAGTEGETSGEQSAEQLTESFTEPSDGSSGENPEGEVSGSLSGEEQGDSPEESTEGTGQSAQGENSDGEDGGDSDSPEDEETLGEEVWNYYTVEEGDTLLGISWKLYRSSAYIEEIKELNQIENEDLIYAGQELIVP